MTAPRIALLTLLAATAVTLGLYAFWSVLDNPHAHLDQASLAPDWWREGTCEKCHSPEGDAGSAAPRYHDEQFRQFTHGRTGMSQERCLKCHSEDGCRDCHARAPQTHTAGFRKPAALAPDAQRHAVLARIRPSACMSCHGNFNALCGNCHTSRETEAWGEAAREPLRRWPLLARKEQP